MVGTTAFLDTSHNRPLLLCMSSPLMAHSCPEIPVGAPLKAALDVATKHGPLILANSLRRPWTSHGFQASWGIAARKAGIVGVTFHDLRGTAVTRLAIVGCTEAEIATITGHSLRDVRSILDANYLHRDPALAESAIAKLERRK
jgi:integrase